MIITLDRKPNKSLQSEKRWFVTATIPFIKKKVCQACRSTTNKNALINSGGGGADYAQKSADNKARVFVYGD